ncbi:MAG: hypothetical protein U9Q66_02265, partial [Patescibacteria group bacterium]|nr:hypothetical protein [Patescibacteria group bacterium]
MFILSICDNLSVNSFITSLLLSYVLNVLKIHFLFISINSFNVVICFFIVSFSFSVNNTCKPVILFSDSISVLIVVPVLTSSIISEPVLITSPVLDSISVQVLIVVPVLTSSIISAPVLITSPVLDSISDSISVLIVVPVLTSSIISEPVL